MNMISKTIATTLFLLVLAPNASAGNIIVTTGDKFNDRLAFCMEDKACKVRVNQERLFEAQKDVVRAQERLENTIIKQGRLICDSSSMAMDFLSARLLAKSSKVKSKHRRLKKEAKETYKIARKMYRDGAMPKYSYKRLKAVYKQSRYQYKDVRHSRDYMESFLGGGLGSKTEKIRCGEFARKF